MKTQPKHKILAVIDVGTNSVLYLVAEIEQNNITKIVEEGSSITRLGLGTQGSQRLNRRVMQKTLQAVTSFYQRTLCLGAQGTFIIATSAVRDAENRKEFSDMIFKQTGQRLILLSGNEEAVAIYSGVASDPELYNKRLTVIDSGGGSTEIIKGIGPKIHSTISLNIGHVRLTEMFIKSDPIVETEMEGLQNYVKDEIHKARIAPKCEGEILIGTGGTITTLAKIDKQIDEYNKKILHGYKINLSILRKLRKNLQNMSKSQRENVIGLHKKRADVITTGAAIYEVLMQVLNFDFISISTRELRYGYLVSMCRIKRH